MLFSPIRIPNKTPIIQPKGRVYSYHCCRKHNSIPYYVAQSAFQLSNVPIIPSGISYVCFHCHVPFVLLTLYSISPQLSINACCASM